MTAQGLRRGEVVIVDFGAPATLRPALVVQNDRDNARLTNTIVAQVTSNVSRSREPTQHLIDPSHTDWQQSGLRRTSVINCANLATIRQQDVRQGIGALSAVTSQRLTIA